MFPKKIVAVRSDKIPIVFDLFLSNKGFIRVNFTKRAHLVGILTNGNYNFWVSGWVFWMVDLVW
jgi:hypothetical protein